MSDNSVRRVGDIGQYDFAQSRANNPHVGLVTERLDDRPYAQAYEYDPHTNPTLDWAGKAEHTTFDVDTVSLHIHERIDARRIVTQILKASDAGQPSLFESREHNLPLDQEIDFYAHQKGWSNRLIAGDSLLVMNSLLRKEGMSRKVQTVYIDPPYGITYNSNFQPTVSKRAVKDGKDEDLTAEPEMVKAFRDTWELGIHSYLSYMRNRLLLARELLTDSGSCFVQIGDENVHRMGAVMDDIFGYENRMATIQSSNISSK